MSNAEDTTRRQITHTERDLIVDFNRQQALEALGVSDVDGRGNPKEISEGAWAKAAECIKRAAELGKDVTRQATLKTTDGGKKKKAS